MQVTDHIHALKIHFKLLVRPGKMLDRFVYAYLIYGDQICLVDSGVAGSEVVIFDYVTHTGRDPREISRLGFPETALIPIIIRSIQAHVKLGGRHTLA